MKILYLSDEFPPAVIGGAGVAAHRLAMAMHDKGNEVIVITVVSNREKVGVFNRDRIKTYQIYSRYHERWRPYLSLYNPWVVKKVKEIVNNEKPEIVHAHNIHIHLSYHSLKIAKKSGANVFLTAHDMMLFHYDKLTENIDTSFTDTPKNISYKISAIKQLKRFKKRYNPFRNIIIRKYLQYVDKIFAVSHSLKQALNQNKIKNVEVIHNAIDVKDWQSREEMLFNCKNKYKLTNKKIVLFVGRLSAAKGGHQIVKAMARVVQVIPEARLLVLGKIDNYAKTMKKIAQEYGIEKELIFVNWLTGYEEQAVFFSSDVVVTPSIYPDPFNLINIEAMAAGKSVVGTCFGGTPEIVQDNISGYIVNPFNVKLLAEKIVIILRDESLAALLGKRGREIVEKKFNLEKMLEDVLSYYNK